jgi:transposase
MSRKFQRANYEESLNQTVRLGDVLPSNHLARFVVDIIGQLDLSEVYDRYAPVGGAAIAPEVVLGLLFYGYVTGIFSSRKIEKATYENIPMRYIAGGLHPDHDTIAHFRKQILVEIQGLIRADLAADTGDRDPPNGEHQPGWEQNPCRCVQEPCCELQAVDRARSTTQAGGP